ncbi:thioredoxin fold domain-containing protein [Ramlibacter sp. AN1133]|uniref:thioredoxin fold domain-containing protein n=1 Tax=Ramlibacter sp. AN1133 TaxID=3133429 RepID=UPI0030BD8049
MMTIREFLTEKLRNYLSPPLTRTVRVVRSMGLAVEVSEPGSGPRMIFNFDPTKASVGLNGQNVTIWPDGVTSAGPQQLGGAGPAVASWTHEAPDRRHAERLYRDIQKALHGGSRAFGLKPILVGVAAAVAMLVIAAPRAPAVPVAPTVSTQAPVGNAGPAASAATTMPASVQITADEAKLVGGLPGVKLAGTGPIYYVFSDPNCPYCRELEKAITMVPGFQPVILPLGYKPGSREISAGVLCSADPAKEWAKAIAGASVAKPCDKGLQQVDSNMKAFEQLRLTSTPTMITPKGVLVSGAASPDELRTVLQQ